VETIQEKVENTRDTGHNEGGVNKVTSDRRQIVWGRETEPPSDEPAVHQWSAAHEKDVEMEEDTGARRSGKEMRGWYKAEWR
jgi:hypothetical protein